MSLGGSKKGRNSALIFKTLLLFAIASGAAGCKKATYPKENLMGEVRNLFKKELNVDARTGLVGRTLYVSFNLDNLVTKTLDLPKDTAAKLETAMLSVARVGLSTDADIAFTVVEAMDPVWGVQTVLVRRMQDLRDLYYWRVSRTDFDERLILETRKVDEGKTEDWTDISIEDFMARWVAARISLGTRANPFLGVLLGIEKMTGLYDADQRAVRLVVQGYRMEPRASTGTVSGLIAASTDTAATPMASSVTMELLKNAIVEQMAQVEKKWGPGPERSTGAREGWAEAVHVTATDGREILRIPAEDWQGAELAKDGVRR